MVRRIRGMALIVAVALAGQGCAAMGFPLTVNGTGKAPAQSVNFTLDGIAYKDKPEESRRFLDRLGNPFSHIGVDRNGMTAIDFGVYGVPETYVVDSSGRIRYRHVGPLNAEDVSAKILPLIEQLAVPSGMPEASKRPG